jgi:hypothetical protein
MFVLDAARILTRLCSNAIPFMPTRAGQKSNHGPDAFGSSRGSLSRRDRLRIAQRFNQGAPAADSHRALFVGLNFSRPFGTWITGLPFPTLKRWAIVVCPSGTGPQTWIYEDTTAQHESKVPQVSSPGGYFLSHTPCRRACFRRFAGSLRRPSAATWRWQRQRSSHIGCRHERGEYRGEGIPTQTASAPQRSHPSGKRGSRSSPPVRQSFVTVVVVQRLGAEDSAFG